MSDKQYTAAEVREVFIDAVEWGRSRDFMLTHTSNWREVIKAEALRRYPDKEDKR
jgi:hypothetical protein